MAESGYSNLRKTEMELCAGGEADREFAGGAGLRGNGHIGMAGLTPALRFS